jgi:hypothetical protein
MRTSKRSESYHFSSFSTLEADHNKKHQAHSCVPAPASGPEATGTS